MSANGSRGPSSESHRPQIRACSTRWPERIARSAATVPARAAVSSAARSQSIAPAARSASAAAELDDARAMLSAVEPLAT